MLAVARRADHQGGNPLFSLRREEVREPRSRQNGTVVKDRVQLRLEQNRKPDEDLLGKAIAEVFHQGVCDYVHERGFAPQDFSMRMVSHHSAGTHLYTGSLLIPLTDWVEDRDRANGWIDWRKN